jgi:hypothetical protein
MTKTTGLTETKRREIFAALVAAQDSGANVPESRLRVAAKFDLDVSEVRLVEREGLDEEWPPL